MLSPALLVLPPLLLLLLRPACRHERGPYWLNGMVPLAAQLNATGDADKLDVDINKQVNHWVAYILDHQLPSGCTYDPLAMLLLSRSISEGAEEETEVSLARDSQVNRTSHPP